MPAAVLTKPPAVAALTALVLASSAGLADTPPASPELQRLDVAAGTWLYQGENLAVANQKGGKWTWREECGWSVTRAFMACSFTMNNPDKTVNSLAVSTYNFSDQSYWHYEMFDSDGSGAERAIRRQWPLDDAGAGGRYQAAVTPAVPQSRA
ncbi:MAG: hypothetical protein JSR66_32015 [Proteobacteria bacterium]|nr:hypothetical protein [Pseudomonadota bacterium]